MITPQDFKGLFTQHMSHADLNKLLAERQADLLEFFNSATSQEYSRFLLTS